MKPEIKILAKNRQCGSFEQQKSHSIDGKDTVYLQNGDNFEIQFFNPLSNTIGVEINMNDGSYDRSKLIIKPGQSVTIDRFLNKKKKFLFETYEIDGSREEALKAIQKNGEITFKFYKEDKTPEIKISKSFNIYNNSTSDWTLYNADFQSSGNARGITQTNFCNSDTTIGTTTGTTFNSTNTATFDSLSFSDGITSFSDEPVRTNISNKLKSLKKETGRIEEGKASSQDFDSIEMKFENYCFVETTIKLLPESEKPTEQTERQYCGFCQFRLRNKNWMFCPKCGNEI